MPGTEEDPVQKGTSKGAGQCWKSRLITPRHVQGHGRKPEEEQPEAWELERREEGRQTAREGALQSGTASTAKARGLELTPFAGTVSGLAGAVPAGGSTKAGRPDLGEP